MTSLIEVQRPADRVTRIVLNRPEMRNAQDTHLLYQLNEAFDNAARDDDTSVIVLAANGPHFSSGHDMREPNKLENMAQYRTVGTWCGFGCEGAEAQMAREKELYLGFCERWRGLPKPTIAEVQGKVVAGGLMLVWPCDIVIAADNAEFADNTVSMGVSGAEFFNHPWELGIRKAKEMLFTSRFFSAQEALAAGMVNHVVPEAQLSTFTLEMASIIARQPLFALRLAKEALNAAQDAQGRVNAQQTAFALHQLCHSHNQQLYGKIVDPEFAKGKWQPPVLPTTTSAGGQE
ncbi:Enoyl-CoA hydratase/isomerase [Mycolicibacterium rhodesiae JS60]|nr:Enoyl-CoA hydratase/isomerase [Mycolicibacterium rhodesiae JS60]